MTKYGTHTYWNITVNASEVQVLSALPDSLNSVEVDVRADVDNTWYICIGNTGVTSATPWDGFILKAGEGKVINIWDPKTLYAIGSALGQKLSYDVNK